MNTYQEVYDFVKKVVYAVDVEFWLWQAAGLISVIGLLKLTKLFLTLIFKGVSFYLTKLFFSHKKVEDPNEEIHPEPIVQACLQSPAPLPLLTEPIYAPEQVQCASTSICVGQDSIRARSCAPLQELFVGYTSVSEKNNSSDFPAERPCAATPHCCVEASSDSDFDSDETQKLHPDSDMDVDSSDQSSSDDDSDSETDHLMDYDVNLKRKHDDVYINLDESSEEDNTPQKRRRSEPMSPITPITLADESDSDADADMNDSDDDCCHDDDMLEHMEPVSPLRAIA